MQISESQYVRYFGSDSPLEVYLAYWKFDGGWEALESYVLEKAGVHFVVPATVEDKERGSELFYEIASQLRMDAANEAVLSAKYNTGVEYGPSNGATVMYDEVLDGYRLKEANSCEKWYWSERIVDMQEVACELALAWFEEEG